MESTPTEYFARTLRRRQRENSIQQQLGLHFVLVFLVASVTAWVLAPLLLGNRLRLGMMESLAQLARQNSMSPVPDNRVYGYLTKTNKIKKFKKRKAIPIYSDQDSAASGGIGKAFGFHTKTPDNELSLPAVEATRGTRKFYEKQMRTTRAKQPLEIRVSRQPAQSENDDAKAAETTQNKAALLKIPNNYYFKRHQAMRWDLSRETNLPTKKLKGFRYLLNMFSRIRDRVAFPGGLPYVSYGPGGRVSTGTLLPQVVNMAILINREGDVLDARVMNRPRQEFVGEALLDAVRGQNFGSVPPEVEDKTWMIEVSFIIPRY